MPRLKIPFFGEFEMTKVERGEMYWFRLRRPTLRKSPEGKRIYTTGRFGKIRYKK
jgi:hypothetical protein